MSKPEKTQRSSGPLLGFERIELEIEIDRGYLPGWEWTVRMTGFHKSGITGKYLRSYLDEYVAARGTEGNEADAWHAASLAREEIWELLR